MTSARAAGVANIVQSVAKITRWIRRFGSIRILLLLNDEESGSVNRVRDNYWERKQHVFFLSAGELRSAVEFDGHLPFLFKFSCSFFDRSVTKA